MEQEYQLKVRRKYHRKPALIYAGSKESAEKMLADILKVWGESGCKLIEIKGGKK